jgi:alkylhydroperoxidase family enzyme
VSTTPVTVTDQHIANLRNDLDAAQMVELTMTVAIQNQRSRFNAALDLTRQGFTDRCT